MTNEDKINLEELVKEASNSSIEAAQLSTNQKNSLLNKMADMFPGSSLPYSFDDLNWKESTAGSR